MRGIESTIADYVRCALLARQAGYDGIEVMGSEGYLLSQFLCARTNDRSDEWGGDIANRIPGLRNVASLYLSGVGRTLASWAAPGASRLPLPASAPALFGLLAALIFFVVMFACSYPAELA